MSFFERFREFLGFTPKEESPEAFTPHQFFQKDERFNEGFRPPNRDFGERSFNIFTGPLEMHKYFEQQMDEMMKSFGFSDYGGNFGLVAPQIEEEEVPFSGSLRDRYLKEGYDLPDPHEKKDVDLDGKLDIKDWGSVFQGTKTPKKRSHFFGQSVTSKTVRHADGSVETQRTVRDHEGNEETTITRKQGDKEYSIVKKRDKDGKEETIENLVNLDEKEVDRFLPKPNVDEGSWSIFDRFFK